MEPLSSKQSLRKRLLSQRQAIPAHQLTIQSQAIANHIAQCEWFRSAQTVFAYRSFRQEISLHWLYENQAGSYIWGFPRCVGKEMIWHQWTGQPASDFAISQYGIEEPRTSWSVLEQPDLILVPTVACDRRGYRLGYGGGYYDRMLSALMGLSTRTIGIVLDCFLFDELPIDPWDQPLDAICTESELLKVSRV